MNHSPQSPNIKVEDVDDDDDDAVIREQQKNNEHQPSWWQKTENATKDDDNDNDRLLPLLKRSQLERLQFPLSCRIVYTFTTTKASSATATEENDDDNNDNDDVNDTLPKVVYGSISGAYLDFETRKVVYKVTTAPAAAAAAAASQRDTATSTPTTTTTTTTSGISNSLLLPEEQLQFARGTPVWAIVPGGDDGTDVENAATVLHVGMLEEKNNQNPVYSVQIESNNKAIYHFISRDCVRFRKNDSNIAATTTTHPPGTPLLEAKQQAATEPPPPEVVMDKARNKGPSPPPVPLTTKLTTKTTSVTDDSNSRPPPVASIAISTPAGKIHSMASIAVTPEKVQESSSSSSRTSRTSMDGAEESRKSTQRVKTPPFAEQKTDIKQQTKSLLFSWNKRSAPDTTTNNNNIDDGISLTASFGHQSSAAFTGSAITRTSDDDDNNNNNGPKRRKLNASGSGGGSSSSSKGGYHCSLILPKWAFVSSAKAVLLGKQRAELEQETKCQSIELRGRAIEKFPPKPYRMYIDIEGPTKQHVDAAVSKIEQLVIAHIDDYNQKILMLYDIARFNPHYYQNCQDGFVHQREPTMTSRRKTDSSWKWAFVEQFPSDWDPEHSINVMIGPNGRGTKEILAGSNCNLRIFEKEEWHVSLLMVHGEKLEDVQACAERARKRIAWADNRVKKKKKRGSAAAEPPPVIVKMK